MKKLIIFNVMFLCCMNTFAQLTIEECYTKALENYPLIKQYHLIEESKDYNLSNAAKGYLPQVSLSAKITYQSDITKLPVDFSQLGIQGMNTLSRDQYGATIDLNQTIWDGGTIKSKKERIRTSSEIEKRNLDLNIYSINDRINQVFFGILLFETQMEQNKLYQEELQRNHDKISSWIENGIANKSDLNAVKVEQVKAIQNEKQLLHTKKAYINTLSILIGEELNSNTILVKPAQLSPIASFIKRPELDIYNSQINNLEAQIKEINTELMPRIGLFITGGYGKPGLNMLENDFSAYYIAGVNLSWKFSNLYTNKNNRRKIQNNIVSIRTEQETFLFNTNINISRGQSEINKYIDQLKYDDNIIELRNAIKQSSEIKMNNGTLSVIDFMRDINAEELAKQDKILHEIELLLAIYNLKFITNN